MKLFFVFAWFLLPFLALPAQSRTWLVEKDGSGDFTIIQDALDAATSGDTLRIGAGRFDDFREYQTNGGLIQPRAMIQWDGEEPIPEGVICIAQEPPGGLRFSGISFENTVSGIYVENAVGLTVDDCRFFGGRNGILCEEDVIVQRCSFSGLKKGVWAGPAESATILNCVFSDCRNSISFQFLDNGTVRRCEISVSEGIYGGGVKFYGAGGGVYDSQITGVAYSIALGSHLNVILERNRIVSPGYCIYSDSEWFVAEDNIFESTGFVAPIRLYTRGIPHTIRNNHILRGTGPAVRVVGHHGAPGYVLDMRDNWWGTTERDSIAAWIYDGNDAVFPPVECTVAFEPFASAPLPTEKKSLGGLKAMFR